MAESILSVRVCTMCGESKPATNEFFAKQKTGKLGLHSRCKICAAAVTRAWREANPGRAAAAAAKWRAENIEYARAREAAYRSAHREQARERSAKWRAENPERHKESLRRYREQNLERIKEAQKRHREANRERIKEYLANWYATNREYAIEYARQRREEDRERDRQYARQWYHRNRQRGMQSRRKWWASNPGKKRVYHQNRLARKRAAGGRLSSDIIEKLMRLQRGKCACCGKKLVAYHLDHIVPLALGGPHKDSNMQLLLPECNMRKGAKPPEEFFRSTGRLI